MKRALFFLLLIPLFFSCSQVREKKGSQTTLKLNLRENPVSLDPRVVSSIQDLTVVKQLFDGLMRLNEKGEISFALAQSVVLSEDKRTLTFTLRETQWTTGERVTAHDFEYAWKKVLDPHFPTTYASLLFCLKNGKRAKLGECLLSEIGVHAQDDTTLIVELEHPTPYFLELTTFPTTFPIHQKFDQDQFISNGPFSLQSWKTDEAICLIKNPSYWESEKVHLDTIHFSIIKDNLTECYLFEKGELDWLGQPLSHNISSDHMTKLKESGELKSYCIAGTYWLKFNTEKAPFNDVRVRKALSFAIPRADIISYILGGGQTIATGILPPTMQTSQTPLFQESNLGQAKELLSDYIAEKGALPKISLSYSPSERNSKIVQLLAATWTKALGIPIELTASEYQAYRAQLRVGNYQVGVGEWIGDFNDPLTFLDLFRYGQSDTCWTSEEFNALVDQGRVERDLAKRRDLLNAAEKLLIDEMPVAPIYHYSFDYVKKEEICDVVLSPLGSADFKYAKKERHAS